MSRNPAFSQGIAVTGNVKTIYVGGQNAVDGSGNMVGKADMELQAEQTFKNLETVLAAGEARLEHIVRWTIYLVQGHAPQPALEVFRRVWGRRGNPPTISVLTVAELANPDFLLEIDAIAVGPRS
ncbi:MAG: RidA family protein [Gemmatimonadota bacterium]